MSRQNSQGRRNSISSGRSSDGERRSDLSDYQNQLEKLGDDYRRNDVNSIEKIDAGTMDHTQQTEELGYDQINRPNDHGTAAANEENMKDGNIAIDEYMKQVLDEDNNQERESMESKEDFASDLKKRRDGVDSIYCSANRLNGNRFSGVSGNGLTPIEQEVKRLTKQTDNDLIEEETPGDKEGLETDRPLLKIASNIDDNTYDEEQGPDAGSKYDSYAGEDLAAAVPESEQCELEGCVEKSQYRCRAFYCCDEYGCMRRFCSRHRSARCFLNDQHEPWPTVCVDCEDKVARCGWLRCLIPTVAVPTITIILLVLVAA